MEKLSRMWKSTSSDDSDSVLVTSPNKRRERTRQALDEVHDDQPDNPYTELQILDHHTDIIRLLLKVADNYCLTAGDDGLAVLWDVSLGRKLVVLQGHRRPITCALLLRTENGYHSDEVLLTGSSDRQIRMWNLHSGETMKVLTEHQSSVKCLVTMRNEELIISGGEKICIWSHNGQLLNYHTPEMESVANMIAIKNDRLVIAQEKQLVVYQLKMEPIEPSDDTDKSGPFLTLCTKLLPHREAIKSLVNISTATFASGSLDGTLVLWGSHTLSRCRNFNSKPEYQDSLKSFPYSVQCVFSMEEHYIFAAIGSGYFVCDLSGQILAEKTQAHFSKIIHMTFVYNGEFLATCSEDGTIRLWGSSLCPRRSDKLGIVEKFLGVTREDFGQLRGSNPPVEPLLVGECLGHSGSVLNLLDFGPDGFVSCGMDALAILWRDGVVQRLRRTEIARDMVIGAAASL